MSNINDFQKDREAHAELCIVKAVSIICSVKSFNMEAFLTELD